MADEKTAQRRTRGTPIDRVIAIMREMDTDALRDLAGVVRGFVAARISKPEPAQSMLELGEDAAKGAE